MLNRFTAVLNAFGEVDRALTTLDEMAKSGRIPSDVRNSIMPKGKRNCPKCNKETSVRKYVCDCGYEFVSNIKEKKEPVITKKEYMKNYYRQNKDKIKERSHDRYKIKKEISAFTNIINEKHE